MPPSSTHTHNHIRRHCSLHCLPLGSLTLFGESAPDVTDKRSSACYMPHAKCIIIVGRADSAARTIHQNTPMLCIFGRNKSTDISILPSAGRAQSGPLVSPVIYCFRIIVDRCGAFVDRAITWKRNIKVLKSSPMSGCDLNIPLNRVYGKAMVYLVLKDYLEMLFLFKLIYAILNVN